MAAAAALLPALVLEPTRAPSALARFHERLWAAYGNGRVIAQVCSVRGSVRALADAGPAALWQALLALPPLEALAEGRPTTAVGVRGIDRTGLTQLLALALARAEQAAEASVLPTAAAAVAALAPPRVHDCQLVVCQAAWSPFFVGAGEDLTVLACAPSTRTIGLLLASDG